MYYIDNPTEVMDNLGNQVNNRIDPRSSATHERNLSSARSRRLITVGNRRLASRTEEQ